MDLVISPKKVVRTLILVVSFLTFAGLAARLLTIFWGSKKIEVLRLFYFDSENTIPTWYSSFGLLLCAILLAIIAFAKKQQGATYALHWGGLAGLFLLMSIDEVAQIHDKAGTTLGSALVNFMGFTPSGLFHYTWLVPGIAIVLIVLLAYLKFLANLPRSTLLLFLLAGGLFVGGAIGTEMVESLFAFGVEESGNKMWTAPPSTQRTFAAIVATEEFLEMLGVVVFIYALLTYISSYHVKKAATIHIQIRSDDEPRQGQASELDARISAVLNKIDE